MSLHPLVCRRSQGVCVRTDAEDAVDLCDLTSHQVEQSFAKHDLKCAGPRANAAVTLAGPGCQLSERLMSSDSRGVPKTNQRRASPRFSFSPHEKKKNVRGNAPANTLLSACVCLFTSVSLCVCLLIQVVFVFPSPH